MGVTDAEILGLFRDLTKSYDEISKIQRGHSLLLRALIMELRDSDPKLIERVTYLIDQLDTQEIKEQTKQVAQAILLGVNFPDL